MNVSEALNARQCVRAFKPDPVSRETVMAILEAASRTPSWANSQPWQVYVAGGETLERLRAAFLEQTGRGVPGDPDLPTPKEWPSAIQQRSSAMNAARMAALGVSPDDKAARRAFLENNRRFFGAPAVVYLCLERSLTPWSIFDVGMMAQSVMLAAIDRGVDSAPAVNLVIYPALIRAALGIPDELMILMGVAFGYRDPEDPGISYRSSRRPVGEFTTLIDLP